LASINSAVPSTALFLIGKSYPQPTLDKHWKREYTKSKGELSNNKGLGEPKNKNEN
jgi:hypothetical protein